MWDERVRNERRNQGHSLREEFRDGPSAVGGKTGGNEAEVETLSGGAMSSSVCVIGAPGVYVFESQREKGKEKGVLEERDVSR